MEQHMNDEDVGNAEDWLTREVQRLQAYQAAQKVLQAYRYAKTQLPQLVEEGKTLDMALQNKRQALATVVQQYDSAVLQQEQQLEQARLVKTAAMSTHLDSVRATYEKVEEEIRVLLKTKRDMQQEHAERVKEYSSEISMLQKKSEEMKKENEALVEVFRKAGQMFNVS